MILTPSVQKMKAPKAGAGFLERLFPFVLGQASGQAIDASCGDSKINGDIGAAQYVAGDLRGDHRQQKAHAHNAHLQSEEAPQSQD